MSNIKTYTAAEIAAYNAAHNTPHRRVLAAQKAEAKLLPARPRSQEIESEFPNQNQGMTGSEVHEMAREFNVSTREIVASTK